MGSFLAHSALTQFFFIFQSRTDRIILKLFGKAPNDFPHVLRAQVCETLQQAFDTV